MLLSDGLGLAKEAASVNAAIEKVLAAGLRTADIAPAGVKPTGTRAFTTAIVAALG
jgi:3-isopropylmalate dehydrogenase